MSKLLPIYLNHLRAAGYSETTITIRACVLTAADQTMPYGIDTATTEEIEAFIGRPGPGRSAWTKYAYYFHFRGLYEWACAGDDPFLDYDPSVGLRRPPTPKDMPNPVSDDEVRTMLALSDDWWRRVILLAAYAGLRCGEIARLRREQVTADRIRIVGGKGNKDAEIPTHLLVWRTIEQLPAGPIVVTPARGVPVPPARLSVMARRHFDALGMPDVHLHRLRHWYATMLIRQGADATTVRTLTRHSSLDMLAGYVEIADRQRVTAVSALPDLGLAA